MNERFSRTARLLGEDALTCLQGATVMVVGLGGVGGHAFEALVRAGVGHLVCVDGDEIALSNCNRQLLATDQTLGQRKTAVARLRAESICPEVRITEVDRHLTGEECAELLATHRPDLVLDCIDTVSAKVGLALAAFAAGIPILACMSTGNKMDPTALRISPLTDTHTCPLCRAVRRYLKDTPASALAVVWSAEPPMKAAPDADGGGRPTPASAPFVPPVAGILMARWAVGKLTEHIKEQE